MAPTWLTVVAWIYLAVCFCCAAVIAYDIFINGRRQAMGVMEAVFPITALYFGPLALAFYWRWGRAADGVTRRPCRWTRPVCGLSAAARAKATDQAGQGLPTGHGG